MPPTTQLPETIPHPAKEENHFDSLTTDNRPFRFLTEKNQIVLAMPDQILMIECCDHFVKVLIREGADIRWVLRHCSMKELLNQLPPQVFVKCNRFYALNIRCTFIYDAAELTLEFDKGLKVRLNHFIEPACFRKIAR